MSKKVLLISSGQPSLNPRLVKEADALTEAGYKVTVLYSYWNDWGTQHDRELLAIKKWSALCIGGDPHHDKLSWFLSRLVHKSARFLLQKTNCYSCFADKAIARSSHLLEVEAQKHNADLYIGHNLGALAATVKAAKLHAKPCGFDAEDFHRQEITDDPNSYAFKISKYLEDKYLPLVNYITASSPLIAEQYALLYKRSVTPILNVFPKTGIDVVRNNTGKPLKLFWFSQTIGRGRGLELLIEAIGLTQVNIEVHLLGDIDGDYKQNLLSLSDGINNNNNMVYFHEPVQADEIFHFAAQFDVGLAAEAAVCLNRDISLTNKLFTYIQSGLAVAASHTRAQSAFMQQYPQTGKLYRDAKELALILTEYNNDRELLYTAKSASLKVGQDRLNWENESRIFLNTVEDTLTGH